MKIRFVLLPLFLGLTSPGWGQGSLTPPAGPPAPTMKSLDQIEPRRAISTLPFTISQSGSYYLTKNLQFTAASGNAITIGVSDVTLDLMGFTLGSNAGVTGDAIRINGGLQNIAVRNGTIRGNTTVTVSGSIPNQTWTVAAGGFSNGINASASPPATNYQFSQLRISGCRLYGLNSTGHGVIEQITAHQNGQVGIGAFSGTVSNCTATFNGGIGIAGTIIKNCIVNSNGNVGIFATSGSVENCTVVSNGNTGISGSTSIVTGCVVRSNKSTGIEAVTVINSISEQNTGIGINAFTVTSSTARNNGTAGISAGSGSVTNCTVTNSGDDGISVPSGSVTNSTALNNGSNGIYGPEAVIAFCKAAGNNKNNNGSVEIFGNTATKTGNKPTP